MIEQDHTLSWMLANVRATIAFIEKYIKEHETYLPDPIVANTIENARLEIQSLRMHEANILSLMTPAHATPAREQLCH